MTDKDMTRLDQLIALHDAELSMSGDSAHGHRQWVRIYYLEPED